MGSGMLPNLTIFGDIENKQQILETLKNLGFTEEDFITNHELIIQLKSIQHIVEHTIRTFAIFKNTTLELERYLNKIGITDDFKTQVEQLLDEAKKYNNAILSLSNMITFIRDSSNSSNKVKIFAEKSRELIEEYSKFYEIYKAKVDKEAAEKRALESEEELTQQKAEAVAAASAAAAAAEEVEHMNTLIEEREANVKQLEAKVKQLEAEIKSLDPTKKLALLMQELEITY